MHDVSSYALGLGNDSKAFDTAKTSPWSCNSNNHSPWTVNPPPFPGAHLKLSFPRGAASLLSFTFTRRSPLPASPKIPTKATHLWKESHDKGEVQIISQLVGQSFNMSRPCNSYLTETLLCFKQQCFEPLKIFVPFSAIRQFKKGSGDQSFVMWLFVLQLQAEWQMTMWYSPKVDVSAMNHLHSVASDFDDVLSAPFLVKS